MRKARTVEPAKTSFNILAALFLSHLARHAMPVGRGFEMAGRLSRQGNEINEGGKINGNGSPL
jgi:hypothetical protein